VPLIGFAGAPFTLACYLVEGGPSRDFLHTKRLMHEQPGTWAALLDILVEATVRYLRAQVAAGAEAVQLFDSWVGGLSPLDYALRVAPWMRRLFDGLAELGVPTTHFGVSTAGLLPLQAATGGDVIGLDWRIALADGRALVGDRAVQGNLDPALLLGPWSAVEEGARWVLDQNGGRPGHVFNLGHGVLPGTDPDQLARLVELVHELGAAP
jgi:uroporphyrinogen decarboxylase